MPITTHIQKRARKSIAPTRPPIIPPPSTNISIDRTVCHLCGYLGRTKSISIEKNGYQFLRYLPPAPGALSINDQTKTVQACHLCVLLLDKQRELNHTTTNFFFKGFFRSNGSCHLSSKVITNSIDEQEYISEILIEDKPSVSSPIATEITPSKSIPPPLRKTNSTINTNPPSLNLQISTELSSLDTFITSIRSRFLSDYTSLMSSSLKTNSYDSCQLCSSIKSSGTLYTISKTQFEFLSSPQINVCTLCYYNLMDQYKNNTKTYHRPRSECYLCHSYIDLINWEIKFLESEYFPFLLNLSNNEQLYDNKRLALTCDQCFYTLFYQYIDQQQKNIPLEKRTYSWQCTYSYENELLLNNNNNNNMKNLFYTSSSNKTV